MNGTTVLIATERGVYHAGRSEAVAFADRHTRALHSDGESLFVVVAHHEIWQAPLGQTHESAWRRIARIDEQVWSLFSHDQELLIGTERAHIYRLPLVYGEVRRMESFSTNPDRENWYTPWGGPPSVRSFSVSTEHLFVNVHVGGIQRAKLSDGVDGAKTAIEDGSDATVSPQLPDESAWKQLIDVSMDVHQVLFDAPTGRLFAPCGRGFAWSADSGESWQTTTDGLDFTYMRGVAVAGETLLVSAATGPHGDRGAIYRRPVRSQDAFERCTTGLPDWFGGNVDTFCLQARGTQVVAGVPGGELYGSDDSGVSWHALAHGLPEINAVVMR